MQDHYLGGRLAAQLMATVAVSVSVRSGQVTTGVDGMLVARGVRTALTRSGAANCDPWMR